MVKMEMVIVYNINFVIIPQLAKTNIFFENGFESVSLIPFSRGWVLDLAMLKGLYLF